MGLMAGNAGVDAQSTSGGGGGGAMMGGSAMGAIIGAMSDEWNSQRGLSNSKKLMNAQYNLNERAARENYRRNMQMWKDTNYGAQVREMEKAGLNKALMYGGSGAGGTTTNSGTNAGVSGGSAPSTNAGTLMAMSNMKELALMDAQRENIEADTANKEADARNKDAGTTNLGATTELTNLQAENQKVLNNITAETADEAIGTIEANYRRAEGEASTAISEGKWSEETVKSNLAKIQADTATAIMSAKAMKAGIKLTEEQTRAIAVELAQGWEELYQKGRANDNSAGQVNIAGFKAKADYAIDKANVDLRAKELMVRGAEAFVNSLKGGKSKGSTTETHRDGDGTVIRHTTNH